MNNMDALTGLSKVSFSIFLFESRFGCILKPILNSHSTLTYRRKHKRGIHYDHGYILFEVNLVNTCSKGKGSIKVSWLLRGFS